MALAAAKTFVAAEVLFAADLNTLNTNILNNPIALISPLVANVDVDGFDLVDTGEIEFRDEAADPTADGRMRRSADELTLRMQDARTNTVARPWAIWADTTGTPAADIGIGMLFQAESGDESPSDFGAIDFVGTDITAASEDTVMDVLLRTAGAALGARYRWQATGAFLATITHALTAARTITIPDASFTIPTSGGAVTREGADDTEGSTTATTEDNVLQTVSGLSIGVNNGILILASVRKTSGAAARPRLGCRLNSTVIWETANTSSPFASPAVDQAETNMIMILIAPHDGTYVRAGFMVACRFGDGTWLADRPTVNIPNASITSIDITGNAVNASVTLAVNFVKVFSFAGA